MARTKYVKDKLDTVITLEKLDTSNYKAELELWRLNMYIVNGVPCYTTRALAELIYGRGTAEETDALAHLFDRLGLYYPVRLRAIVPKELREGDKYLGRGRLSFIPYNMIDTFAKHITDAVNPKWYTVCESIRKQFELEGRPTKFVGMARPEFPLFAEDKNPTTNWEPCPAEADIDYEEMYIKAAEDYVKEHPNLTVARARNILSIGFCYHIGVNLKSLTTMKGKGMQFKTILDKLDLWEKYFEFIEDFVYGGK